MQHSLINTLVKMEFGDDGQAAVTILGLTAFRNQLVLLSKFVNMCKVVRL